MQQGWIQHDLVGGGVFCQLWCRVVLVMCAAMCVNRFIMIILKKRCYKEQDSFIITAALIMVNRQTRCRVRLYVLQHSSLQLALNCSVLVNNINIEDLIIKKTFFLTI